VSPRRADLAALGVLALAAALLVPQTVLLGKLPDHFDYWLQEYVHLAVLHRWLNAGVLPLWNGQLVTGTPHLADPQTATLYPLTTLPLLLLPPAAVARLSIPLHFFLAGALTYGFGRTLGLSRPGAVCAGLGYALAPHFAPLYVAGYLQQSAVWLPAILWALHGAFGATGRGQRLGLFAAAGALWALQLFRGYPQTWYLTGLCAAACVLVEILLPSGGAGPAGRAPERGQGVRGHQRRLLLVCGGVFFALAGLGLGAAQLLPGLALLAGSQREGGFTLAEATGRGAVGLGNLLGLAGPDAEVSGAFPGGVLLGLALAGVLYGRGRRVWLALALAAAGLALSLGDRTPLWGLLYHLAPGFSSLHMPHRTLFVWSLGLALLAGCGLDALRRRPPLRPLLVAGASVALLAWLGALSLEDSAPEATRGALRLAGGLGAVLLGAALLHLKALRRPPAAALAAGALAALAGTDLLLFSLPRLLGSFYPPGAVYAAPPAARWLQARQAAAAQNGEGPFRFASAVYQTADAGEGSRLQDNRRLAYLPPNTPALYPGLEAAQGYLAIRLRETGDLFGAVNDQGRNARTLSVYDPRSRLLDLMGVRYFVTDGAATFPSLVGGGRSLLRGDPPAVVPVREPLPTAAVEVGSRLEGAAGAAGDEVVGTLTLDGADGQSWSLPVLAGEANRVRFDLTPLGRPAVRELRFEATRPGVRWNVDRVVLQTPFEARFRLAHAEGDLRVWENPGALPRAWWVGQYVLAEDAAGALAGIKEGTVAPGRTAVLTAPVPGLPPAAGSSEATTGGGAPVAAAAAEVSANRRRYAVDAPAAGLLVISETLAPGWQATVDGAPAPLYAADGSFQAVAVPAGRHVVEVRYLPQSVVAGAAVSLLSAVLLAGAAALGCAGWLRRRRRPGHEVLRGGDAGRRREASAAVDVDGGAGPAGPVEQGRVPAFRAQRERDPLPGVGP
jgi:hypothetical protein